MTSKLQIKKDLELLAIKLGKFDAKAAQRLRDLCDAVDGTNTQTWAAVDIHKMIEPDMIIEQFRSTKGVDWIIGLLEWIRNVLIFAPLILTWYGISQAVAKYSDFVKANSRQAQQPFLYLWQQGFSTTSIPATMTLSQIAFWDFILLFIMLVCTFIVYFLSHVANIRRDQEASQLHNDLLHTLTQAALCLASLRITASNKPAGPTMVIDGIDQVAGRIEALVQQLTARFEQTIQQIMVQVQDERKRIEEMANRHDLKLDTLLKFKDDLLATAQNMERITKQIQFTNSALTKSIDELVTPAQELATGQKQLIQVSKDIALEVQNQVTAQQQVIKTQEKAVSTHEKSLKEQEKWTFELRNALNRLNVVIESAEKAALSIGTITKQQGDLLKDIQAERTIQKDYTNKLIEVSQNTHDTVIKIDTNASLLNNIAVELEQINRSLAAVRTIRMP
jgi:hypothetical protein